MWPLRNYTWSFDQFGRWNLNEEVCDASKPAVEIGKVGGQKAREREISDSKAGGRGA